MTRTDPLRKQHADILAMVRSISGKLTPRSVAMDPMGLRTSLSQLAGLLSAHLALEDKSLYPELLKASEPKVVATAKQFIQEMGGIGAALQAYLANWPTPRAIESRPQDFIRETSALFEALGKRVAKEESVLYALADKA